MGAVLHTQALTKSYGSVRALGPLTVEVEAGIVGLLGANGAGKSTLLRCMLGLIPFEGEARVLGHDPRTESFRIRERVGYMPEGESYLPGMSAVEMCAYAGELCGLPRTDAMQRAHSALYHAGLDDKRYQKVESYSTGQKQRVKLAQALVHDPELLFLDEPTNGLDPRARAEFLELIAELPERRGCTVLFSTHILTDVDRVCDRAVVLHEGLLHFSGTIEALRTRERLDGVREFDVHLKVESGVFEQAVTSRGATPRPGERPWEYIVALPSGISTRTLFEAARASDSQVRHLAPRRESVEQAFLRVLGEGQGNHG